MRPVVVGICVYEAGAILSGRYPTLSQLCKRRRVIEVALLTALLVHLHRNERPSPRETALPDAMFD